MRIRIRQDTRYVYERPARAIQQVLRVTPRSHDGQHVIAWRLDADADVRLSTTEDAFGNIVQVLATERPTTELTVTVTGEVAVQDTAGIVRGAFERLPEAVYLRRTALTEIDPEVRAFAKAADPGEEAGALARAHALSAAVSDALTYDVHATDVRVTAAEALRLGHGVCQDMAHLFVSAARHLGLPARYVSGHLLHADDTVEGEASHAWAEAAVPRLGWVGFDPANRVCPTDHYVRVAVGLDYLDAAPVRGSRSGGGGESMTQKVHVSPAQAQSQTLGGMTQTQWQGWSGQSQKQGG